MPIRSSLSTLALLLAAAACIAAVWQVGTLRHWDWQAAYLAALAWAFVFWNSVRILTYVPTLRLLLKPGASAEHYSIATWASWVLSNATLALYLFEAGGRTLNSLVLLNTGNALMCFVTCALIVRLRWRNRRAAEASPEDERAAMPAAGEEPNPGRGDRTTEASWKRSLFIVGSGERSGATASGPGARNATVAVALRPRLFGPERASARRAQ